MRGVRYHRGHDEKFEYANSLLAEASDYLRPYELRALVRADMTEEEAGAYLQRDKAFFHRLANLLPSILRFFSKEGRLRNPRGIVWAIDDCHNDFHFTVSSSRRDRQIREAKERLTLAARVALESALTLEAAKKHFQYEFDRYREVYYRPAPGPARFLGDLIDELRMCAGVAEIAHATVDIESKRAWIFGNDERRTVVEEAYRMCSERDGPKLVTTPGSDFATLCSLLFEAVSGKSDEGLAGAINRYARSDARKDWDRSGEEDDPNDNFLTEKAEMANALGAIELCKSVLQKKPDLSKMAIELLHARIKKEEQRHEEARTRYGPRQVYFHQMNKEQVNNMFLEAINRFKPEQIEELDDAILRGESWAARDIEHGRRVRLAREKSS